MRWSTSACVSRGAPTRARSGAWTSSSISPERWGNLSVYEPTSELPAGQRDGVWESRQTDPNRWQVARTAREESGICWACCARVAESASDECAGGAWQVYNRESVGRTGRRRPLLPVGVAEKERTEGLGFVITTAFICTHTKHTQLHVHYKLVWSKTCLYTTVPQTILPAPCNDKDFDQTAPCSRR